VKSDVGWEEEGAVCEGVMEEMVCEVEVRVRACVRSCLSIAWK
jgi:hypothetical protein